MCGRYYIEDDETIAEMRKIFDEINQRYQNTPQRDAWKTGEIFPTDTAPVLIGEKDAVQPVLMKWGYPKWQGSSVIINARAETADEKPMFRASIRQRRCIIPSSGFFEWDHTEGHAKTKFLLHRKESSLLYMAGLYSFFEDPNGNNYSAYVILTVPANSSVLPIHTRMPLVVEPGHNDLWLQDESYARSLLNAPCQADLMAIHTL